MQKKTLLFLAVSLTAIHFCQVFQALASPTCSESTGSCCDKVTSIYLQCSAAVFPFIGYKKNLELCSKKSVCWPTNLFVKNNLFVSTPCLLHHSHPVHWDQTKEVQEQFTLVNNLPPFVRSSTSVATFGKVSRQNLFHLDFPLRHQHARWPIDVTEPPHGFCYHTTDLGYARHMSAIGLWFIGWLNFFWSTIQTLMTDKA